MHNVFIIGPDRAMHSLFSYHGKELYQVVDEAADADAFVWTGGQDIGTSLYHENHINDARFSKVSFRDQMEKEYFDKYPGVARIGVCRGAQLLCVLSGGRLWQHVDGHFQTHKMLDLRTNKLYDTTSIHHQMMIPPEDAEIIAVADKSTFKVSAAGKFSSEDLAEPDIEVIYIPRTRSFCIQGHPEYNPDMMAPYFFQMLDDTIWRKEGED